MINSEDFYTNLPIHTESDTWFHAEKFVDFDASWYLIVVDIKGSTKAIESGRYKDVNIVGALTIIALLNEIAPHDLPFVFGGDGATILVPQVLHTRAQEVLAGCAYRAQESFSLELRAGIIPLKTLYERGETLEVLKYCASNAFHQAILKGSALDCFENGIKSGQFETIAPANIPINLQGLECRWQDIKTPKDITLSLLVEAQEGKEAIYHEVMQLLNKELGNTDERNAISKYHLHTSKNPFTLLSEIRAKKLSLGNLVRHMMQNILGTLLMYFEHKTDKVNWGTYKNDVRNATDSEKFDGSLKMVVTARHSAIDKVQKQLDQWYRDGTLFYGIHKSSHALMTCLVYERNGAQIHFVDASDGGYAMAAKYLKQQKRSRYAKGT